MGLFTQAESLGFYSAWGNDHLNTPRGARYRYDQPPNVYEILITLAGAAAITERIRLGVAALTLPQREPVALAKQVATLDVFSKGRVSLAVGIGHYRDEFVNVRPRQKHDHRGEMFEEALEALNLIFTQDPASFSSKYYEFEDISLHPKPLQDPLPIYITGTGPKTPERVVRWGTGWMLTNVGDQTLGERIEAVKRLAENAGRDPSTLEMAHTIALRVDPTHEKGRRQVPKQPAHERAPWPGQQVIPIHQVRRHPIRSRRADTEHLPGRNRPHHYPGLRRRHLLRNARADSVLRRRGHTPLRDLCMTSIPA